MVLDLCLWSESMAPRGIKRWGWLTGVQIFFLQNLARTTASFTPLPYPRFHQDDEVEHTSAAVFR